MKILPILTIISFLFSFSLYARTWTNTEGKSIEAEYLKLEGDSVKLKMNGKEFSVPLDSLSQQDQDYIQKQNEAPEITVKSVSQDTVIKPKLFPLSIKEWVAGDELTNEDLTGKVVVAHAWQSHCGRCPSHLEEFAKLARRKKSTGATFLIWHHYDKVPLAKSKSKKIDIANTPVYHGKGLGIKKWDTTKWGEFEWPWVVIFTPDGEVGYLGAMNREFDAALKELTSD